MSCQPVRWWVKAAWGLAAAVALLVGPASSRVRRDTVAPRPVGVQPTTQAGVPVPPDEARKLIDQLNRAPVDPGQIYVLRHAQIARDRVKIYFNRGFIAFLSPVAGRVSGAVFSGEGEVLLVPPDAAEKRNLAEFTGAPILEERFTSVYLCFTDRTADELRAVGRRPDPDDPEQPGGLEEEWSPIVERLNPDHSLRVLRDLLGDRSSPYFYARFGGANLGVFEVTVDERLTEAVRVAAGRRSHGKLFGDIWCSFPSRASKGETPPASKEAFRVRGYRIDARIDEDHSLDVRANVELESQSTGERVLVFELSRHLRVDEVRDDQGRQLEVFQQPSLEESRAAERGNDWVAVVLAAPRESRGERFHLSFAYRGRVIEDLGNGVLYVGARGSWYPNFGRGDRVPHDLVFHYPDRLALVATGSRVEESSSARWKHARWVSDGLTPVAGFNLGAYESRTRRVEKATVEVYATRQVEPALDRPPVLVVPTNPVPFGRRRPQNPHAVLLSGSAPPVPPSARLDTVAERAARALHYFGTLFGSYPYPRLAISQVPGATGQGWPELIYLPTLSFLPPLERSRLVKTSRQGTEEFIDDAMLPHEIAHQWWGNELGWMTYRDQWLSEGFSSYAAALFLAHEKDGEKRLRAILRAYKQDLLAKTPEGKTIESGGPVWLGMRLSNSLNPDGYNNIVYKKACWIVHMLRMLLADPGKSLPALAPIGIGAGPAKARLPGGRTSAHAGLPAVALPAQAGSAQADSDERFFKMLRDFIAAYHGRDPSTDDFARHAEKYLTPSGDLDHTGSLDWFFNEWVYSTGIPTYRVETTVRRRARNQFVAEGAIRQSGVSEDFEMLVPLVAIYGRDRRVPLGRVAVTDRGGKFRFLLNARPARIAVDDDNILAVVHEKD